MKTSEARDEMFAMLLSAWENGAGDVLGYLPDILWQGQEKGPPSLEFAYARASVVHNTGRQASLAGEAGAKRFRRTGILFVQCFAPLGIENPLTIADNLGRIVLDAFEGRSSPGGIWFRSCRLNEIGPTDGWYQVNVIAEFSYDEVK